MKRKFDKDMCVITLAAALTLSGASLLTPITSVRASTPSQSPTAAGSPLTREAAAPASKNAAMTGTQSTKSTADDPFDDDDPDELLEHWSDPKYIHEEQYQLGGMFCVFLVTAGVMYRNKLTIRRLSRG